MKRLLFCLLLFPTICLLIGTSSCTGNKQVGDDTTESKVSVVVRKYPDFSADSAFAFIQKQVDFGYRIPGTQAHARCADWLYAKLKMYCDTVYYQKATAITWDKKTIPVYNIVGVFKPKAVQRGLWASHWDSRPWADNDTTRKNEPIAAANDGASGVGVLLELARNLKNNPPTYGIDIVFFDAEDYGKGEYENSFCLGSQYWAKNPHVAKYRAQFGVLLDMVGGKDAVFGRETLSMQQAGWVMNHTWSIAEELGFGSTFTNDNVYPITDDHHYVFQGSQIPMIDIIQHDPAKKTFAHYWHTHADDMSAVNKETLQKVGKTMSALMFNPPVEIQP
jgi:hypothetical protein